MECNSMSLCNRNFELLSLENVYIDIWLTRTYWWTVLCIVKLHLMNQFSMILLKIKVKLVIYNAFASEKQINGGLLLDTIIHC